MARRGRLGLAATLMAFALTAGSAQAATATLGNPLTGPGYFESGFSSGPYTITNTTLASGQAPGSPVPGTVIDWTVGSPDGGFGLQILRHGAGATYSATQQTSMRQLVTASGVASAPQATSLPIAVGDVIALRVGGGTSLFQAPAGTSVRFGTALYAGESPVAPGFTTANNNYVFSATVRYCLVPNLKGTKKAKVRKVLGRNDCAAGRIRTLKRKAIGPSVVRVASQSPAAGTAISDTQGVDVTLAPFVRKKK